MVDLLQPIIKDILYGSFGIIISFLKVLIPLMITIEILMTYNLIEKLADRLKFISSALHMEKQSLFPLLVGVVMGLTYGAGTLIEINAKTPIPKKDFILIGTFLFICHGIIETALLFGVAGANVWVITLGRLALAFVITFVAARLPAIRKMDKERL